MTADTFWLALALVLIIEGLFPLIAPATWRRLFLQLTQLEDSQIRHFAIGSILVGLLGIWVMAP